MAAGDSKSLPFTPEALAAEKEGEVLNAYINGELAAGRVPFADDNLKGTWETAEINATETGEVGIGETAAGETTVTATEESTFDLVVEGLIEGGFFGL